MEPPAVTRNRRPFLAPVWLTLLAVFFAFVVAFVIYRSATTTVVVLVSPIDKDAAGTIDDPPLSPDGELRAQRLAQMLGETTGVGRLDAVYVSATRRAQQEIAPLADRLNKKPEVIPQGDIGAIASHLTHGHDSQTVLYVGNSSTVTQLVHELSGLEVGPATQKDHDSMYVVSLPRYGQTSVLRLSY
jgi:phosphohistidine phosphatase SixA